MKKHGISQLPVVDDRRLAGIVTESDLLGRLVEGQATLTTRVGEVMFRRPDTVSIRQPVSKLLELFSKDEVGVVLDLDGRLVGILTKMDLVDHLTGQVSAVS
ncbi:MAG: CBS domain-containing protein [Myxococcales bacterium]|nr:CBS domain-containing protein [Myxococcales bacterium]